ncbi:MAG: hypothetical protein HC904_01905 [Blastochloris sp.]|nr:hypothetical protein [Blastochloris sp.]
MSLQHLTFDKIEEASLQGLVQDGASESRVLEFKADLQLVTDEQKRESLSDITALANTDGGDLVLGMRGKKGAASELVGLRGFIADDQIGRIENLLRDSVQPRASGLQIKVVLLENGNLLGLKL